MATTAEQPAHEQALEGGEAPGHTEGENDDESHQRIAQAVARLLRPTIVDAVEGAMNRSIQAIKVSLEKQAHRLTESENRINLLKEDVLEVETQGLQTENTVKFLLDKLDDLENQARRNNLRIIGIPESYNHTDIMRLCTKGIPEALGISTSTPVERAHRLGPLTADRKSPRAAIAAYLNYADKASILQRFRNNRQLVVEDIRSLFLPTAELSKRRKAFSPICSALAPKSIKFSLLIPAELSITTDSGRQLTFLNPDEADSYLHQLEPNQPSEPSPFQQHYPAPQTTFG